MFGRKLQALLLERGISIRKFASDLGVSPNTAGEWVGRGERFPSSPEILRKIASYFQVSVHELLFDEPDPFSPVYRTDSLKEFFEKHSLVRLSAGKYLVEIREFQTRGGK